MMFTKKLATTGTISEELLISVGVSVQTSELLNHVSSRSALMVFERFFFAKVLLR